MKNKEQLKHTPGPWRVSGDGYDVYAKHPHGFDTPVTIASTKIADDSGGFRTYPFSNITMQANAHLMAAAKDLLAVAKSHLDFCGFKSCPTCKMAYSAIDKVEGK